MELFQENTLELQKFVDELTIKTIPNKKYQKINVGFSSGGITGIYHIGISAYLVSLYRQKKIDIHKVYGASVGAFISVFFVLLLKSEFAKNYTIDSLMKLVHNNLYKEYKNSPYLASAVRNVFLDILPEDIHLLCNDFLNISFYTIHNGFIKHNTVNQFASKQHVIDIIHNSSCIPYITIPTFFKTYSCPYSKQTFWTFDGIFLPKRKVEDNIYPTLIVDLLKHSYPKSKILTFYENSYYFLAIDGIQDAHLLFYGNTPSKTLYFDAKQPQHFGRYFFLFLKILHFMVLFLFTVLIKR